MIVLQHNCAGVRQVVVAVTESVVEFGADLILLQEEKRCKDSMPSHVYMRREETDAAVRITL